MLDSSFNFIPVPFDFETVVLGQGSLLVFLEDLSLLGNKFYFWELTDDLKLMLWVCIPEIRPPLPLYTLDAAINSWTFELPLLCAN